MSSPAKFFKLKQNGKRLDDDDYVNCLITYFDNLTSLNKLTLLDLQNVLGSIQSLVFGPVTAPLSIQIHKLFLAGEHVIVVWQDRKYMWELAVVQKYESPKVVISHLVSTNSSKSSWVFPEEAIVFPVDES